MKVSSSPSRRAQWVLPAALLVAAAVLLPTNAPAPVHVVRAPAQALVAFAVTSGSGTVSVPHHVFARLPVPGAPAVYLPVDADLTDVGRDDVLRVRFRLHNSSEDAAQTVTPLLQYRSLGGTYATVPDKARPGGVFHTRVEWVRPRDGRAGTVTGPTSAVLRLSQLRMSDDTVEVGGHRSAAANPDVPVRLPAGASTEQEFTLGLGPGAAYGSTYELRLTDAGRSLGSDVAAVSLGEEPPLRLSPGQRQGQNAKGASTGSLHAQAVQYPIVVQRASFRQLTTAATAIPVTDIHGPYSTTPDQCGVCHRAHTASGPNLLVKAPPQAALCLTCHDGTGASHDVKAEYDAAPASNPDDRAYYQHDALAPSTHTLASREEFAGVLNRHSECGDCHNPHQASSADSTQTATGWTSSGRLRGVSGVAVSNGPAGTAPSYTFLDGVASPVTAEYQLCLKCHSGYTTLPSDSGFTPSRFEIDKGLELNPNNGSFHPVEAPGTNVTQKMADSLSGTSPYKLWNFSVSSTIRCTQCHAAGSLQSTSPTPGGRLQPHTSANRGILIAPYKDRVLNSAATPYQAASFQLCLACHGEAPFASQTWTGTNFPYHGLHLTQLAGLGAGGTDIDTPGAGQGNAICAECHFRLHSPASVMSTQDVSGEGLVSFAPDVQGLDSSRPKPAWGRIAPEYGGGGSCALTCHGFSHNDESY